MALTSKRLLAIDWDRRDLRMAVVRAKGDRLELIKAVSVPLPADLAIDNAEMVGAFIREAMRQSGIGARHALIAVPRDKVVLNTMTLPPMPADDLAASVQFQIVKELPFAAEQATIDFSAMTGHDPKSPCVVLVAAVRHEDLDFYKQVAREAGLTLEHVGLRPFANLRAVQASDPELQSRMVLIIEVGPHLTEINIVNSGTLAFSRAALVPLPSVGDAERDRVLDSRISTLPPVDAEEDETTREAVSKLMVDVIRSYEAHRATVPQASIDQIVVCGATGLEQELAQSLSARFAARATLYSPERVLDLTPQRAKELRGFSAVLGLAIGQGGPALETFDFLKPKKPISKRTRQLRKAPIAAVAAVLFVGAAIVLYQKLVAPQVAESERLRQLVIQKQGIEKPYNAFLEHCEALQEWKESEQRWPEVLAELSRVFPPEEKATVDRIDFTMYSSGGRSSTRSGRMALKMRVAEAGTVNALSDALRDQGFKDVEAGSETPRGVRSVNDIYRFDTSIRANLPDRTDKDWSKEGVLEPGESPSDDDAVVTPDEPMESPPGQPAAQTPVPASPVNTESPAPAAPVPGSATPGKPPLNPSSSVVPPTTASPKPAPSAISRSARPGGDASSNPKGGKP